VTGQTATGLAHLVSDLPAPAVFPFPNGMHLIEIWKSGAAPEILGHGDEEPAAGPMELQPPTGGSVFRIADIPPDNGEAASADEAGAIFEAMGAANASTHEDGDGSGLMHRTPTLDYGIVIEGSITLVLDDGEVHLSAGDVVVQRGANHGWSNRSGRNCRMAFVMIDAVLPNL
jgi:mannose-6-phosphate isomerase-like protein (cupin superfamily)